MVFKTVYSSKEDAKCDAVRSVTDENNRLKVMIDERDTKILALENQITDAENSLRAFKDAVMLVVKELAKE